MAHDQATQDALDAGPSGDSGPRRTRRLGRQRSRLQAEVADDTVAAYSAARAFLLGEWFGASLAVASFTLLYLFAFASTGLGLPSAMAACLALLALGVLVYLRSRMYYLRVGFDYAPRWHVAALVVAGAAGIFWLLFAFLATLAALGYPVVPGE